MIEIDVHVRVINWKHASFMDAVATAAGQPWHAQPHVTVTLAPRPGRTHEDVQAACWYLVKVPLRADVDDDFFAPYRRRESEAAVREIVRTAVRERGKDG